MTYKEIAERYCVPEAKLSEYESWTFNMKTRTDILNHLAEKYQLKRYMEIGLQNAAQNFDKIKCDYKVSVDPDSKAGATFEMTSDEFFKNRIELMKKTAIVDKDEIFHLIFIDGLHEAQQVEKDFHNALKILSWDGFIVLHDCNPEKEEHTIVPRPTKTGHWNGNVYQFAATFEGSPHVCTVAIDNGCMVIQKKQGLTGKRIDLTWDHFNKNRKQILNLISWDEFTKL